MSIRQIQSKLKVLAPLRRMLIAPYVTNTRFRISSAQNGSASILRPIHSTPPAFELDERRYETLVEQTLEDLAEKLELYLEQFEDHKCDVILSDGVLTINLGGKGIYVINKQTPNRQIWLSSPLSGPKRYDYVGDRWVYRHDGNSLTSLLEQEFQELFSRKIKF